MVIVTGLKKCFDDLWVSYDKLINQMGNDDDT